MYAKRLDWAIGQKNVERPSQGVFLLLGNIRNLAMRLKRGILFKAGSLSIGKKNVKAKKR